MGVGLARTHSAERIAILVANVLRSYRAALAEARRVGSRFPPGARDDDLFHSTGSGLRFSRASQRQRNRGNESYSNAWHHSVSPNRSSEVDCEDQLFFIAPKG